MGKPSGFLDYTRELPAHREPRERVMDWQEITVQMKDQKLQTQAARCMECSIPFCHTGIIVDGMISGCPNHNLIPEWNDLVYRGLWREAYERLNKTNNFPEFTGRVCPAVCEGACTAGLVNQPVTIKNIEYAIVERAFAEGWIKPRPPGSRTGKKVAVVGSGPAGLACAAQLNKAGHLVTVFERADRIGGLLMYGIPNVKLDKKVVERRVNLMKAEGIKFVTRTEVGKDFPAGELLDRFDAVVLCGGAARPRDLPVAGRDLQGVHYAIEFLSGSIKSFLNSGRNGGNGISAKGKDVVVIGGGDTGTDCVATALRQGCKSVVQLEIMPHPPSNRSAGNPWPQFPRTYKVDYAQEEAAAIFGLDPRHYNMMTREFIGDGSGRLGEIHTVEVEWVKEGHGRMLPREMAGTGKTWPAQLALLAMGFTGPEDRLPDQLNLERDELSNVRADYGRFDTNVKGVFAAGDMRRGQSLVIWAINEGRGAARECDRYLMGSTNLT